MHITEHKTHRVSFGFWLYLMSDCLLFASLFATYAVVRNGTFGGVAGSDIFSLPLVFAETIILLTSSFTIGLAVLYSKKASRVPVFLLLSFTFVLGSAFVALELKEFAGLLAEGNNWSRSAFLSSFFTLVATHGAHVVVGLAWMVLLMIQLALPLYRVAALRRLMYLALFWHFLDVVWIGIFTFVYLFAFLV